MWGILDGDIYWLFLDDIENFCWFIIIISLMWLLWMLLLLSLCQILISGMQRKPIRGCDDTFQSIVWLYIASVPIMFQFTSSPIKDWCYYFKFSFNFAAMLLKMNRLNNTYVLPIWIQFGLIWMKIEGELEKITPPYFCQEYKIDQVT